MTAGLLRAEWLKLRRMGITWLILVVPAVLALLGSLLSIFSMADVARRYGSGMIQRTLAEFAFPQPAMLGLQIVDFLGPILILIFMTAVVGNEFSLDTWKNLLTRHAGRGRFLIVKLAYALAEAGAAIILVPAAFQAGVLFALRTALDITPSLSLSAGDLQTLSAAAIITWLRLAIAACLGLLASVVTRSSGGALAIAAPWLLADSFVNGLSFVGGLWRSVSQYTFNLNLGALDTYLRGGAAPVSLAHCLLVLSVYTAGFIMLAIMVFRRRDIAG